MSYDLAVFDPRQELRDPQVFYRWYDERTEWEDDLDYNDPSNLSAALRAWFDEIRAIFPPMNGPHAARSTDNEASENTADFTLANDIVYVAFRWPQAEIAYETCIRLAERHGVGFLDASGNEGAAWFPNENGSLEVLHTAEDE